jgi:pyrimidine operon attenuation protein/uracil phosphoribosyltransferase
MLNLPSVETLLATLSGTLRQRLARRGIERPLLVGIRTGGVWVAERLRSALGVAEPLGLLDISFHRDDFDRGLHPTVRPSELPLALDGRHIVLVDDVLYTGRTIRAAINELFDWGRPASVTLAVLVARDGRELPIQADAVGAELALARGQELKLRGPEPLRLEVVGAP